MLNKKINILMRLMKFRLSLMVTFSAVVGYFLVGNAAGWEVLYLFLGVLLLAGGSCSLNEYQERHLDKKMNRTQDRPIPNNEISATQAVVWSWLMIAFGTLFLLLNGTDAAILGLSNVFFYNGIYTPLKTRSVLAVFPGALVGAVPPMIGWVSAGGYMFHPHALFIASFMFIWQIPHFWLLMIKYGSDYEKAGFPTIARYFNPQQVKGLIFSWVVVSSVFLMLFPLFSFVVSKGLTLLLVILNLAFIALFFQLLFKKTEGTQIRSAFILVNSFMMLMLLFFMVNAMVLGA